MFNITFYLDLFNVSYIPKIPLSHLLNLRNPYKIHRDNAILLIVNTIN